MKLNVGERLDGAGPTRQPGGYLVTAVVHETPWYGLYTARKLFYNFDFSTKRVRETDEKEWLDVFLRTICYPLLDDAEYVDQRRALARVEVRAVLGNRSSDLWPEPIDLLEIDNTRDSFRFTRARADTEPVVVFARPHGLFLSEWVKQPRPITAVLSALAELLEFVNQAHAEGLLLLGLSPDVIVIDALERVHYVGSDVALMRKSPLLSERALDDVWARLYPPQRFPSGFAAPECFQSIGRPDARSDLFAWGCLAYYLLTGQDLAQLAQEQGKPWLTFHDAHYARLEQALAQVPTADRVRWAEQLGVAAGSLLRDWPRPLVQVLRRVLDPNAQRRPNSTDELRGWLVRTPVPPVSGFVALQQDATAARLLIDPFPAESELGLRVVRGSVTAPVGPNDGVLIYEGPACLTIADQELPLTIEPVSIYYTVFATKTLEETTHYSPGVTELLWFPEPSQLRRWVEQQAVGAGGEALPARVARVLESLHAPDVAESLHPSAFAHVRLWGLRRLELALQTSLRLRETEPVLWRFLADPVASLRTVAATCLWTHGTEKTDERLLGILEGLEANGVDSPIALAPFLRQLGLSDAHVTDLLRLLDERRPAACPACGQAVPGGGRAQHLRDVHGYLDDGGELFPADVVRERLWDRVLREGDQTAHDRLVALYNDNGSEGLPKYVNDVEARLFGGASDTVPRALSFPAFESFLASLRRIGSFPQIVRLLLRSSNGRLREMGREALLPVLAQRLRGANGGAPSVWQALEDACPGPDYLEERLAICERLPALGVDAAGARACHARLLEERLTACAECGREVRLMDLEQHLRRAHRVFEFRGVRGTYQETRAALLWAVCTAPPDLRAWQSLEELADEKQPEHASRRLVAWLFRHLRVLERKERRPALVGLAEALSVAPRLPRFLPVLLAPSKSAAWQHLGRRLALESAGKVEPPADPAIVTHVLPLLAMKSLPRKTRLRAALGLLRLTGRAGAAAEDVLRAYLAGRNKVRALERLRQLEQRFEPAPAIDVVRKELQDEVPMTCPRCPTQLLRRHMVDHLWERHRLILDDKRVREPWRMLEAWAEDYSRAPDAALLESARELARKLDAKDGLTKLYRLMLKQGVRDRDVLAGLFDQAGHQRAGVCPHCFSFVPVPEPETPPPLLLGEDTLEGCGYHLAVSERGLTPTLTIESPHEIMVSGREPGRGLTTLGTLLFLVGPLAVGLFCVLSWLTGGPGTAPLLLLLAGGLGLILTGIIFMAWPAPPAPRGRLLRAAWDVLVPQMLAGSLGRPQWSFLHGLAELSQGPGEYQPPRPLLVECLGAIAKSTRTEPLATACLGALCRLFERTLREAGHDAVSFIAGWTAEGLRGNVSLRFVALLLEDVRVRRKSPWKTGETQRLQVLVAARAFEIGLTVDDLANLGRAFPTIREALALDDRSRWTQLERVWQGRERRPWEWAGPAVGVFELADSGEGAEAFLHEFPDVLLCVRRHRLHVTSRGVWFLGTLLSDVPRGDALRVEELEDERSREFRIGAVRIKVAGNERIQAGELEAWLRYYFEEFLPKPPTARRSPLGPSLPMWQTAKAACPDCGRGVVPCTGDLSIALK